MSKDILLERKLKHLYSQRNAGMKFGLDVQTELMKRMDNPQTHYAIIHVAGTNGKGSVCAILGSILKSAGLKVGIYTSPHLVEFNERISVDGVKVTDAELVEIAGCVDAAIPGVVESCGREPTFFEYATAMAFKYFSDAGVQIAVIETGLGGRLDATNICEPLLSVITNIGLEHTAYLGCDLAAIAGEKAGIIKKGRPVICAGMEDEAREVIVKRAGELGCCCREVDKTVSVDLVKMDFKGTVLDLSTDERDYGRMTLPLPGAHQVWNLAAAIAAYEEVQRILAVDFPEECIKRGVESARWLGRCHLISEHPPVILDGAHNPSAAVVLADTLKRIARGRPLCLVIGMCGDKDVTGFMSCFHNAKLVYAVSMNNERAVASEELCERIRAFGLECRAGVLKDALANAEAWALDNGGIVCVTGSLFLVGEVLELKGDG